MVMEEGRFCLLGTGFRLSSSVDMEATSGAVHRGKLKLGKLCRREWGQCASQGFIPTYHQRIVSADSANIRMRRIIEIPRSRESWRTCDGVTVSSEWRFFHASVWRSS